MKKTWLHRAVSVLMSGVLLSGMLGTPAAAAQRQVDAYGRDSVSYTHLTLPTSFTV